MQQCLGIVGGRAESNLVSENDLALSDQRDHMDVSAHI